MRGQAKTDEDRGGHVGYERTGQDRGGHVMICEDRPIQARTGEDRP